MNLKFGRDSRIRTYEYHSQSVVPYHLAISLYGVNDGTRTHDNQNHNLALYQLNYIHHLFGAPSGGRTLDTLIKSQVLYQLS